MSNEFVKISSLQGLHDTSGHTNLVDFVLPTNSGSYDLSQSYVNINVSHNSTDAQAVTTQDGAGCPDGVYNIAVCFAEGVQRANAPAPAQGTVINGVRSTDSLQNKNPAIFINHARFECAKGRIEDIRNLSALKANMEVYDKDFGDYSNGLGASSSLPIHDRNVAQNINNLNGDGNIISEKASHDIRIPLKDIFNSGVNPVYDTSYFGYSKIHLELLLQKMVTYDLDGKTTILAKKPYGDATLQNHGVCGICTIGAAGQAANTFGTVDGNLVSNNVYHSLEDSPFYVGKRMAFVANEGGGGPAIAAGHAQIAELIHIDHDRFTGNVGHIEIKLTAGMTHTALTNNMTYQVTFTDLESGSTGVGLNSGLSINAVELVAKMTSQRDNSGMEYSTYVTQEDTTSAGEFINRTYMLPPNTMNVVVMFPNPTFSIENLTSYRLSLNGDDVTNRTVDLLSAQHNDLIGNTMINRGQVVKNLEAKKANILSVTGGGSEEDISVIMCPVKLSNEMTQFNLELTSFFGQNLSGKIAIYSEVMKQI